MGGEAAPVQCENLPGDDPGTLGQVIGLTDPLGNWSTAAYDALDRLTSRTDALSQTVSYGYDANGNLTSFTDARNTVRSPPPSTTRTTARAPGRTTDAYGPPCATFSADGANRSGDSYPMIASIERRRDC